MKTIFKGLERVSRSLPMLVTVLMLGLVVEASATDFCWRDSYGRGVSKNSEGRMRTRRGPHRRTLL